MMRKRWICLALAALLCASAAAHAQMTGLNAFKKPNIADLFKPAVGNGAVYETQRTDQEGAPKQPLEMTVVGKELFEGRETYWQEFAHTDARSGSLGYAKMLMTKDDFQPHRMIVQQPGQPAMELPLHAGMPERMHMPEEEALEKWHLTGSENITVPAGTFSCQHWKKDEGVGDVWTTGKISPFGMVKYIGSGETMVLIKVITDAKDHLTGPVETFDPEEMKRQMMEKMQQQENLNRRKSNCRVSRWPSSVAGRMDPISVAPVLP